MGKKGRTGEKTGNTEKNKTHCWSYPSYPQVKEKQKKPPQKERGKVEDAKCLVEIRLLLRPSYSPSSNNQTRAARLPRLMETNFLSGLPLDALTTGDKAALIQQGATTIRRRGLLSSFFPAVPVLSGGLWLAGGWRTPLSTLFPLFLVILKLVSVIPDLQDFPHTHNRSLPLSFQLFIFHLTLLPLFEVPESQSL